MLPKPKALWVAGFLALAWAFPGAAWPAAKDNAGGHPPAAVQVVAVEYRPVEAQVTLTGSAEAHRNLSLAARLDEVVKKEEVEEGDIVRAGELLIQLEPDRLKLQLAEAKAVLREAKAVLAQLKRDLDRKESLHKSKTVPLKDLEDAQTAVDRQQAVVDRCLEQARLLERDLQDTEIRAPVAGVVVRRLAYRGEWVKKGGAVLELAVLDPLKVVVPVPERYMPHLSVGQRTRLSADALPGEEYEGRIQAIIPKGDVKSRTFPVQVQVPNPAARLKPGMLMRVTLAVGQRHQAILVPKDALVLAQGAYLVYVVNDGQAKPVTVKAVAAHDGLMEVQGNLQPGQKVVTVGNERLRPGQAVRILEHAPKPQGK